jgi:outer membrane protein OmpA-like peptidoglycan-associated protein
MQINRYFPLSLIAVAILAGCATPPNSSLAEAHNSYDNATRNPQVTRLAPLELKQAGDSLNKADSAFNKGESSGTVDQLAYIARQQVGIAQETAKRKEAEAVVANASANRDQVRLAARTAEANSANQQLAVANETANQQAAALAVAGADSERDQALIARQDKQLRELKARKTDRGLVITLGDVLFNTNQAQLKSRGMHSVRKLGDFLKQYPQRKVLIEGYTDSAGGSSHNQLLSERRANAVQAVLVDMGIDSERISTRGYGEAFPVAGNDTAAGRKSNRRVEIVLSDDKGNSAPRSQSAR